MYGEFTLKIHLGKRLSTAPTYQKKSAPGLNGIGSLTTNTNSSQPGAFFEDCSVTM